MLGTILVIYAASLVVHSISIGALQWVLVDELEDPMWFRAAFVSAFIPVWNTICAIVGVIVLAIICGNILSGKRR